MNGWEAIEKIFNILNHHGYANQQPWDSTSHQSEWLGSKIQVTADAGEDVEKEEHSSIAQTQRSSCLCLWSAGIKGMCHHCPAGVHSYLKKEKPFTLHPSFSSKQTEVVCMVSGITSSHSAMSLLIHCCAAHPTPTPKDFSQDCS